MTDFTSHSVQHSVDSHEPDPDFVKWLRENCVSLVGLAFGALIFCLVVHNGSITVDWTRTKDFTEAFANLTQSLALIGAGGWAYFKFAKGRTFRDRLTPTVSAKFVLIDGSVFLAVTTRMTNVGLAKIAFNPEASTVIVFDYILSETGEIMSVVNNRLTSFRVFGAEDKYIEPNEMVERQCLIVLPRISSIGYQLEFEVVSESGYSWRATTIVDKSAFEDNEID